MFNRYNMLKTAVQQAAPDIQQTKVNRANSNEGQSKFANMVLLAMNVKKSPWLLSRCKDAQNHMHAICNLLRPEDSIKVVVNLASTNANSYRYMTLVSVCCHDNREESLILGIDVVANVPSVSLVLPVGREMDICMDGDGGFFVTSNAGQFSFKPVSVQEMWSALQCLVKAVLAARNNYHPVMKPNSDWISHYNKLEKSDELLTYEWIKMEDVESPRILKDLDLMNSTTEQVQLILTVKRKLRDIMMNADLANVTSKEVREKLEDTLKMNIAEMLNMSLSKYKHFIDEEMVVIMRQMDSPSMILDYLYLGSEWNASNLEELQNNGVEYILNVTKEIDNFFPGIFKYCNVRVYDYEETELVRHWNNTFKFIAEAKRKNSKILVHCKMGVSRSASTVIAYLMKAQNWTLEEAYQHVKQRRNCVQPNPGFMQQLIMYQGILDASNNRHSKLFRSRSSDHLDDISTDEEEPVASKRKKTNRMHSKVDRSQSDLGTSRLQSTGHGVIGTIQEMPTDVQDDQVDTSDDKLESEIVPAGNFLIVDADDNCRRKMSRSVMSIQDDSPIDDSTLSKSSLLRQWSSQVSPESIVLHHLPRMVARCSMQTQKKDLPQQFRQRSHSWPSKIKNEKLPSVTSADVFSPQVALPAIQKKNWFARSKAVGRSRSMMTHS